VPEGEAGGEFLDRECEFGVEVERELDHELDHERDHDHDHDLRHFDHDPPCRSRSARPRCAWPSRCMGGGIVDQRAGLTVSVMGASC
jgi:hypothetical protein